MTLRTRLIAAIPPLVRRDEELARRRDRINELTRDSKRLTSTVATLEAQSRKAQAERKKLQAEIDRRVKVADYLARPSFHRNLVTLRRTSTDLRGLDLDLAHPLRQLPFKLRNYRFAASHGVPVPTILRTWSRPEDIDLEGLPEAFVVKSDGGAGSHGVIPLRRGNGGGLVTLDGLRTFTLEEVREHFVSRAEERRISGPYFAEEVLRQPGGGPIPDDIKLYSAYGEVLQVLLKRVGRHGDLSSHTRRYVDARGTDLGEVLPGSSYDHAIPVPANLAEMVEISEHISSAVGLPFCRIDLYNTDQGIVLGEVTRAPGGKQHVRADHDEAMGLAWERAAYRLDLDLLSGRPPGLLHGERPTFNPYPEGHVSRSADPGAWEPRVVPCDDWCLRR